MYEAPAPISLTFLSSYRAYVIKRCGPEVSLLFDPSFVGPVNISRLSGNMGYQSMSCFIPRALVSTEIMCVEKPESVHKCE